VLFKFRHLRLYNHTGKDEKKKYSNFHIILQINTAVKISVNNELLELFPQKAILWHRKRMLLIADAHLGKINHFRKNGVAVPTAAARQNLEDLVTLVHLTAPERVLFLGDLFHSGYNYEWEALQQVIRGFPGVHFELVEGNHDILEKIHYELTGMQLHGAQLEEWPFVFTHHPMERVPPGQYNLAGHLHPGITLYGNAKQGIKLPCFVFSSQQAICPAFGVFTGLAAVHPAKTDRVFVVADNEVVEVTPA
jgi:DNA ligase-associated metallophosphoesterase